MSTIQALQVLVLIVVAAIAAVRWRSELLLALPLLVVLNGISFSVGGATVRFDQLAACALCIPLALGVVGGRRRLVRDRATWYLCGILAMNVIASLVNSPARGYSLQQCANLASSCVMYVVVVNFTESEATLERLLDRYLLAAAIAASIAALAFIGSALGVALPGADLSTAAAENLTRPFGAFGTMLEPNILGSYCAASFVLAMGVLALDPTASRGTKRRKLAMTAAPACAIALVFSFTRSAWLGAFAGLSLLAILVLRTRRARVRNVLMPVAVLVGAAALVLLLPGTASAFLRYKLANFVNPESPTAVLRLLTYTLALQQSGAHPIIGWGTFTFAPLVAEGADFARFAGWRSIWIPNFLLLALHDTGVLGLILWIALLAALLVPGWRAARSKTDTDVDAARAASLTIALATLLIPFLLTTGFSLGYPWLLAGLLGARARLAAHRDS